MTSEKAREWTRGDLMRMTDQLKQTTDALNGRHQASVAGELLAGGSPAANDSTVLGGEVISSMLGSISLLLAAAMDHADTMIRWGNSAVTGQPTPVWSPWSVARSLVEVCGPVKWLCEPELTSQHRAGRALTFERRSWTSYLLDADARTARVQEIEADAVRLEVPVKLSKRDDWVYYGLEPFPKRSDLVHAVLEPDELDLYEMLSAATHGDVWAIQELGYRESGDGSVYQKAPSVAYLLAAIAMSDQALSVAGDVWSEYRMPKAD